MHFNYFLITLASRSAVRVQLEGPISSVNHAIPIVLGNENGRGGCCPARRECAALHIIMYSPKDRNWLLVLAGSFISATSRGRRATHTSTKLFRHTLVPETTSSARYGDAGLQPDPPGQPGLVRGLIGKCDGTAFTTATIASERRTLITVIVCNNDDKRKRQLKLCILRFAAAGMGSQPLASNISVAFGIFNSVRRASSPTSDIV